MLADILLHPLWTTTNEKIADMPFLVFGTQSPGVYRLSLLGIINSFVTLYGFRPLEVDSNR